MPRRRDFRNLELVYLPSIFLAALLLPVVTAGWLLPKRVALSTHSLANGTDIQNLWVDVRVFFGVLSALWAACWLGMFLSDRESAPSPVSQPVYGFGAVFLTIEAIVLLTAAGRSSAETGPAIEWFGLTSLTMLGGWFLATRLEHLRARTESAIDETGFRPRLGMPATKKAVWIGSQRGWGYNFTVFLSPLAFAGFVIYAVINQNSYPVWGFAQWLLFTAMLAYSLLLISVEVVIGRKDVSIRGGPLRVPLKKIPLDAIEGAEPLDVRPRDYGGWGYHPKRGRTAFIVRGGDGLLIHMRRGRDVVVTIQDSEQAAALINDLVEQRSEGSALMPTS